MGFSYCPYPIKYKEIIDMDTKKLLTSLCSFAIICSLFSSNMVKSSCESRLKNHDINTLKMTTNLNVVLSLIGIIGGGAYTEYQKQKDFDNNKEYRNINDALSNLSLRQKFLLGSALSIQPENEGLIKAIKERGAYDTFFKNATEVAYPRTPLEHITNEHINNERVQKKLLHERNPIEKSINSKYDPYEKGLRTVSIFILIYQALNYMDQRNRIDEKYGDEPSFPWLPTWMCPSTYIPEWLTVNATLSF